MDSPGPVTLSDKAMVADRGFTREVDGAKDFQRVAKWRFERCRTMTSVRDEIDEYTRDCHDYKKVRISSLAVDGKKLILASETDGFEFTRTAVMNLAGFGGRAIVRAHGDNDANPGYRALRAYFIRRDAVATSIFDQIGNDFLKHISAKRRALVRTYCNGATARRVDALLTDRYGIIDNLWFVDALAERVVGGRWARFRSDGRTITGHYLIPDDVRLEMPDYGAALGIKNSEVGKASLYVQPSVFLYATGGSILFGHYHEGEAMRRVHKGDFTSERLNELKTAVSEHIDEQIPLFDHCIQQLEKLKGLELDENLIRCVVVDVGDQHNMTHGERRLWWSTIKGVGDYTAFGVVSGLATASQSIDEHGRDMELDAVAGRLSNFNIWDRLTQRAATVDDEKVKKVLDIP